MNRPLRFRFEEEDRSGTVGTLGEAAGCEEGGVGERKPSACRVQAFLRLN